MNENENKNPTATIIADCEKEADREPTPYDRLQTEKRQLDDRIVKLNAFLSDGEKAEKIAGFPQVGLMQRQLEVMLEYSSVLNTRILRWKK